MATISQRITLEGAEDIRKKLEDLGKAGEQAFKQIQDAAKKPIVDPAQIDKSKQAFDQLAAAATRTGAAIQQAGQQAETAGRSIGAGLGTAAQTFTIAATAIVFAISAIVRSLTSGAGETAQTISAQADKLSLTIPQWLKYRAAIDAAGGSQENFIKSTAPLIGVLNKLSLETSGKTMQTFADGTSVTIFQMTKMSEETKKLTAELAKFGISLFDIRKGDSAAIMEQLAAAIAKMPANAQQAAAGVRFFGQDWKNTIATLTAGVSLMNDTRGAMGQMRIATRQMSTEQVTAAKNAADQWDDLGKAIRAIKDQIGVLFAGSSFARAEWLTHMVDDARILLTTFLKLDAAGRASFLAKLGDSAAETTFKVLVALGEQLAGIWNTLLVPAGEKLMGIFDGIAGIFEGITGSQVAAFFITAAIAAAGLALALKGIALVLTPLSALLGLVFSPFGAVLLAAAAAAALFWDELKAGAQTVAALIPQELAAIGQSITKLFSGDFSGFWDQFSTAAVAAFQKIAAAAEADKGVVGQVFRGIKQIIADLPGTIVLIAEAFIGLGKAAQGVADIINKALGTDLKATDIAAIVIIGQMTGALDVLAKTAVIAGVALGGIASAVAIFGGPVTLAILAAAAAAALLVAWWPQIKQAAIDAGNAIAAKWNELKATFDAWVTTPVGNAWQWIKDTFWGAVGGMQSMMDTVTGWIRDWVTTPIGNAFQWIVDKWNAMLQALGFGGGAAGGAVSGGGGIGHAASGGLLGGRGSGTSDSNLAWLSRGEYVMPARVASQPGILALLEALRRSGGIAGYAGGGSVGFSTKGSSVNLNLSDVAQRILEQFPLIQQMLDNMLEMLAEFDDATLAAQKLQEFAQRWLGMAGGGVVGGRGTGTSDSNLAWVSRGEHVMPAAVVRQPGVLALLEALRRGGDLRRLLDGMGRFAAGGLVAMPALAGGGTGSMSHVTIQFPGGPTIGGLRASSQVVEELQRAAAMAQVRSGGRKPSRYT